MTSITPPSPTLISITSNTSTRLSSTINRIEARLPSKRLISKWMKRQFTQTGVVASFITRRAHKQKPTFIFSSESNNHSCSSVTTRTTRSPYELYSDDNGHITILHNFDSQMKLSGSRETSLEEKVAVQPAQVSPVNNGLEVTSLNSQILNVDSAPGERRFSRHASVAASINTTDSADADPPIKTVYLYKTPSRASAPPRPGSYQYSISSDNASSISDLRTFYTAASRRQSAIRPVDTLAGGRTPHNSQPPPVQHQLWIRDAPMNDVLLMEEEEQIPTNPTISQFPTTSIAQQQVIKDQLSEQLAVPKLSEEAGIADDADDFHSAVVTFDFEVADITDRLRRLGKMPTAVGGNSDVWKGEVQWLSGEEAGQQVVAIKVLRAVRIKSEDKSERLWVRLHREVHVWSQLQNDYIVPLVGFAFDGQFPCMVSPWYECGNVLDYITKNPEVDITQLVLNVTDGLIYLHGYKTPIVHGDLKAANVLVDDFGVARIADFGLSTILQEGNSGFTTSGAMQGSIRWMAPELFYNPSRTTASDVYSLTLLALEIHSGGMRPFHHLTDVMFLGAITQFTSPERLHYPGLELQEHIWQAFEAGWHRDPDKRPTAGSFRQMYVNKLLSVQHADSSSKPADSDAPPNSVLQTDNAASLPIDSGIKTGFTGRPRIIPRIKRFVKTFRTKVTPGGNHLHIA